MITFKELSEAHKVGDKVTIVKGPKDVKGKEGRIGEIRKQVYKGAPKTYTVDYDHHETTGERKSVQLQSKHIKGVKEQVETLQEKHRVAITVSDPNHPALTKRKELIQKTVRVKADNEGHAVDSAIAHYKKAGYKVHDHNYIGTVKEDAQLDELSTDKLAAYKTKAAASAKASDQAGDYKKGDKRFAGINKATRKQFDNDLKKHGQYQKEAVDKGEYDYEGQMARTQLQTILRNSEDLIDMIDDDENMPEWVQSKITLAQDYITTVRDYLQSKEELGEEAPANNVGSGNIAGTQGDAGKKTVMTKAPLKRKLKFEEFSNLLDDCICETADAGLAAKAAKSGISIGTLRKVYRRGVAAWNSGHRPGTTPQQWGMARVNSYITKGKGTYHGADKDLREDSRSDNDAYHKGVSDSTAKARVSHWKKMDKLSDKNPEAYKPAPGDATAKTKLSKHTIKYRQMFGEDMDEELYEACWDTHKQVGMKKKNGKMVPNCVPKNESVEEQFDMIEEVIEELASLHGVDSDEIWQDLETIDDDELLEYAIDAKGHKSSTGGLTQKGVDAYNAKTGGNLQTAVTTKPSKLKPGSKAANRRKSFCARMGGMKKRLTSAKTANDPDSRINKALRKWNC
jgi:hypothetical protein